MTNPNEIEQFDLIVLGGGSAARDAAYRAHDDHGASVALVERTRWGGSCPNIACWPTKAYLVAAELLHDVNVRGPEIGLDVPEPVRPDLARIRAWKESLKRTQAAWVEKLSGGGLTPITGQATFVDASTIQVGERLLTASRILVATGSRTAIPATPGIEDVEWLDHVSALELEEVPESLLILGAGPVGLEFAQIFGRFGSRVTIVNQGPQIAARSDVEAAASLQEALEAEGIEVLLNGGVEKFRSVGGQIRATLAGAERTFARLLLAVGRVPNVEELELERAGVEAKRRGITVDRHQRTTADGIWAAGDVAAGPQFTPTAVYQSRLAVDDMFGVPSRPRDYSFLPTTIFTDPELSAVGSTEAEAREEGLDVEVACYPLSYVTRAVIEGQEHGLYKIVFDPSSRRVLGVHVVSRRAGDVVQGVALALSVGATIDDLALAHYVYPSYGEGLVTGAGQALVKSPQPV